MNRKDILTVLEFRFERELSKTTGEVTTSLADKIRRAPETEKREIFDEGLRELAASLTECVSKYLPKFAALHNERSEVVRLSNVENEIRRNLCEFLAVPDLRQVETWTAACRFLAFTRTVCRFGGDCLPAWFDIGFLGAGSLSRHPALFMEEEASQREIQHLYQQFAGELNEGIFDRFGDAFIDAVTPTKTQSIRAQKTVEDGGVIPGETGQYSELFDNARLAPRQRQVASLTWEHEMEPGQIARRLRLHRTTVDESLESAKRKMDHFRENDRARKDSAVQNSHSHRSRAR
ncbi:MAG: hypothetical protein ABSD98_12355 [Candidatus Korobacteraceae bacterium]|jgi:DNA-binding CsgD family transcriptional regulator